MDGAVADSGYKCALCDGGVSLFAAQGDEAGHDFEAGGFFGFSEEVAGVLFEGAFSGCDKAGY